MNLESAWPLITIDEIVIKEKGSIRMGPFGSQLKKDELVNKGIRVLFIDNVKPNLFSWEFSKFIKKEKYEQLKGFTVKPGDVLITMMGTIGRTCVVPQDIGTAIISSHLLKATIDQNRCVPQYLSFLMNYCPFILGQIQKTAHGAIMSGLNTEKVKGLKIPLPSLSDQNKLVAILEKADHALHKRQETLRLTDQFLQSAFLKMFGDPVKNPKGWKIETVDRLARNIQYGFTASASEIQLGPKFLRITDIQVGQVDWKSVPYCRCSEIEKYKLKQGDIVFARTGATTGKSFLIKDCPPAIFASYLIRIQLDYSVSPVYVYQFFQTKAYWSQIKTGETGSTQGGFNATKLGNVKLPIPPLSKQQNFASLVEKTEILREKQHLGVHELGVLYQSLMQKAFKGKLLN